MKTFTENIIVEDENSDIIHLWEPLDFNINNDVPVIPMVFKFRKPKGIRKIFKRKKDVTLVILEPIKINHNNINKKICIEKLKQKVYEQMKQVI